MNFYRLEVFTPTEEETQIDYGTTNDVLEYLEKVDTELVNGGIEQIVIVFSDDENPLNISPRQAVRVELSRVGVDEVVRWQSEQPTEEYETSILEELSALFSQV